MSEIQQTHTPEETEEERRRKKEMEAAMRPYLSETDAGEIDHSNMEVLVE